MARFEFGGSTADYTAAVDAAGAQRRVGGIALEVRRVDTKAPVTDVVPPAGWTGGPFPGGQVLSDRDGDVRFLGPDGFTARVEVRPAAAQGRPASTSWWSLAGQPASSGEGSGPVDVSGLVTKEELAQRVSGFSITAFGAVAGSADCTPAVRRAAAAAATFGGVVVVPPGSWRMQADAADAVLDLPAGVSGMSGDGLGTTELVLTGAATSGVRVHNPPPAFDQPTTTLTANAAAQATSITVASTAGIAAGTYLLLGSTKQMASLSTSRYEGEWVQVRAVEPNGVLQLFGKLAQAHTTADGARVWRSWLRSAVTVRDLTIRHEDRARDSSRTELLTVRGVDGLVVDNVRLADGGGPGCGLEYVINFTVNGLVVDNLRDFESDGSRWFGYGLYFSAGAENGTVTGCSFRQMRHAITTVARDGHAGEPRGIVISGCIATECTLTAFDTHAEGDKLVFSGCVVHDTGQDAFVIRSKNTAVIGCVVDGAQRGVYIPEQRVTGATVKGSTFRNIVGHGVEIAWWGVGRFRITGNTFDGIGGTCVMVPRGVSRVLISKNDFLNYGQRFSQFAMAVRFWAGAQVASAPSSARTTDVQVVDNVFGQDQGVGRTLRAVVVDSDAGVDELLVAQNTGWRMASDWMQTSAATTATVAASNELFALTA